MRHVLATDEAELSVQENQHSCTFTIEDITEDLPRGLGQEISLDLQQLHSLIGTLLHIQQRLKSDR